MCGWHTSTNCFEPSEDCFECIVIEKTRRKIAERVYQYGEDTHPKHSGQYACLRCDITAAYRYAAQIVKGEA